MLSKTFAAAALVATAAAYSASDLPSCWSDCFSKYQADETCLCSESLGKVVSHCIAKGCDSASNEAYVEWLSGYCNSGAVPATYSNTWTAPVSATTPPAYTTSTPSAPAAYTTPTDGTTPSAPASYPSAPGTAPPSYPSVASAPPPYPFGTHSGSVCLETSTLIWRSSTSVTTYEVTATGGWAYPSGTPGAASGTGAWPAGGSAPPVPYTGGAVAVSSFKAAGAAGLAIFVGAAALML